MKISDVAQRVRVQTPLIQAWSAEFDRFLSPLAHSTGIDDEREFSEIDLRVFATVAELRNQGWAPDQVEWVLDHAQADERTPQSGSAVMRVDYRHALEIARRLEGEVSRLIGERNDALLARDRDLEKLNDWNAELQRGLGIARGRLETIENELLPMRSQLQVVIAVVITAIVVIPLIVVLILYRSA